MIFALGRKGNLNQLLSGGCLSLDLPKKDSETRIWVQVVYLGDDPRKHGKRV